MQNKENSSGQFKVNVNLPKFDLPVFDGSLYSWFNFKQIFLTTIHENESLTKVQKLQYLQAAVVGDAARLIKGFPITESNYEAAWDTLKNRYDNKRELAYSLCSKIFSQRPIKVMSSKVLHDLLDSCNEAIRNLRTLGLQLDTLSEIILVHFLQRRIDDNLRRQWELTLEGEDFPSYNNFINFLEKQARSMQYAKEVVISEEKPKSKKYVSYNALSEKLDPKKDFQTQRYVKPQQCKICKANHPLFQCETFRQMNIDERWNVVRENKLCFNCLRINHSVASCKNHFRCKSCNRMHHTLLHEGSRSNSPRATRPESEIQQSTSAPTTLSHSNINKSDQVLLSTAIVKIKNQNGNWIDCRALLDSGSQMSLITKDCCAKLNLKEISANHIVKGTGNISDNASALVKIEFTSLYNKEIFNTKALVMRTLTTELPNFQLSKNYRVPFKKLNLADPEFYISRPVDLIIGADLFLELILGETIKGKNGLPSAIKSKLGWVLLGPISAEPMKSGALVSVASHHSSLELETVMKRFWELESIDERENLNVEQQDCEKFYRDTSSREASGRYKVKLPFKSEPRLGQSRIQAIQRFLSLEKKLQQNQTIYDQYKAFMNEYLQLNHMEQIPAEEEQPSSRCYYMPHHAVVREQSITTKLRVVFDASARTSMNVSLNDFLHTGPKLQAELFCVLTKFRTHPIVITADIEKMFRQIRISEDDVDLQRIVWRSSPDKPLKDYRLLTVTYGTACAPYLAIKTLHQLAEDEKEYFPEAAEILKTDFYVDDLLSGATSIKKAQELVTQLRDLLNKGGFQLRKWLSNEPSVISSLPSELKGSSQPIEFKDLPSVKLLGICWDPVQDTFGIQINASQEVHSKRQLLSSIARIYDPLGFLSPTSVIAKIMIQELWAIKSTWDEQLPETVIEKWNRYSSELFKLRVIRVPRFLSSRHQDIKCLQIHGFCDASQKAYSAVIYMRTELTNQEVLVNIIAAKTRVAPLKTITIPRLELCGALLLSKLYKTVIESISLSIDKTYFWTDSQIVLEWITSEPYKWKIFVANRVSQIRDLTPVESWHYVKGQDNPADCASRGIHPSKLATYKRWWQGPEWLSNPNLVIPSDQEPSSIKDESSEEVQVLTQVTKSRTGLELVEKYSSYSKLIRVVSWCYRFIQNCKTDSLHKTRGHLTSSELNHALIQIVKLIQQDEFHTEIHCLKTKNSLPANSHLLSLNPFLDENQIMRVGGRLKHSSLPYNQKYPILIPSNHHFTTLIIQDYHKRSLHAGTQVVLSLIRERFWVVAARNTIKRTLHKCITCFKSKSHSITQMMGNLPKDRVVPTKVFQKVGIDFAGPFTTKPNVARTKIQLKSYIALFVCFTTKAIHLEVVSDLTTESFLACLRRFISRRGTPSDIYSDHGTNFLGARNYLRAQAMLCKSKEIQEFAASRSIQWHFIPPKAPHHGGLWEANIKSMKHHLLKTCKTAVLNFEQLSTLTTQIEACLNSRPLTPLSNDPEDLQPLTPGHFLTGEPLLSFPEFNAAEDSVSIHTKWKLTQALRAHFWKRWSAEYLTQLQCRRKWKSPQENLQINQLVLLKEDNSTPLHWNLGRIVKVLPGDDGLIRVVEVQTSKGTFRRPISKISPLPLSV